MDTSCPSLDEQALALLTWLARVSTIFHIWPATTRRRHLMLIALMRQAPYLNTWPATTRRRHLMLLALRSKPP
ncbi:hypothetical protein TIFTF001_016636 [Ficus carica]|uniref:Uncharacterized protein n=1 Tax=Ficus carica TaxID=3494 RepID=A0AA88DIV9_FICCA|nr:hypothetical protein TIFTF001_016636 [Ficus carica]